MQVQVWPGKSERVVHALPPPLKVVGTDLSTALLHIGDGVVLYFRNYRCENKLWMEIFEVPKAGGIKRLNGTGTDGPFPNESRRLMWLYYSATESKIHREASVAILPDSYTRTHPIMVSFKTSQGAQWVVYSTNVVKTTELLKAHECPLLYHVDDDCKLTTIAEVLPKVGSNRQYRKVVTDLNAAQAATPTSANVVTTDCDHVFSVSAQGNLVIVDLSSLAIDVMGMQPADPMVHVCTGISRRPVDAYGVGVFEISNACFDHGMYLAGTGKLFHYDSHARTWTDIRFFGNDWIPVKEMWVNLDDGSDIGFGAFCMAGLSSSQPGDLDRTLMFTEIQRSNTLIHIRDFNSITQYSVKDIEDMYDATLRVGSEDFKVIAAAFCGATRSEVLKKMLFGDFKESIRDSKRSRVDRVVDLTELLGDDHQTFERIYRLAMRGSVERWDLDNDKEGEGEDCTLQSLAASYRMAHALGMTTVQSIFDLHIDEHYIDGDSVMDVIRNISVDYMSPWLLQKCVETLLNECTKEGGTQEFWCKLRAADEAWADKCMRYVRCAV